MRTTLPLPSAAAASPAAGETCCQEFARVSRRGLFSGGAAVLGATAVIGSAVITASPASAATTDSVMVVLSLRGAADGLSLVVPYSDPVYYAARKNIAVKKETLLETDGTFGLHPSLAPLQSLWKQGRLAAVHGTGLPAPNRSHFSAMEEVEDAAPGSDARQGWLNRLIGTLDGTSPLQGFNLGGGVLPTSLFGPEPVMAGRDVDSVGFAGDDKWDDGSRLASLHSMWDGRGDVLGTAMRSAFASVRDFAPAKALSTRTANYPNSDLGRALAEVARVIRGNVGANVITVDQGEWDMHTDIGNMDWGRMKANASDLAKALAAFFADIDSSPMGSKVTLVALSEFGRRVQENSNWGLDHGYGNVMFVAGAGVKGGYHGQVMPLENTVDADVAVTTDYRSVLSEVVTKRFGASSATVFPGFQPESVGVVTSL